MYQEKTPCLNCDFHDGSRVHFCPIKAEEETVKNVVAFFKLDKDQRAMRKAGMVDDNGNLTEEGKTVLLNVLLEDHKPKMAEFAREYTKAEKNDETKSKD